MDILKEVRRIDEQVSTHEGVSRLLYEWQDTKNSVVCQAASFATRAHHEQVRKYVETPYVTHTFAVAAIVSLVTNDENMVAAAILHDTVEDTPVTIEMIERFFGSDIAALVSDLTDVSVPEDGNRETRKTIDREHTAAASQRAKTVKLADLLHNTLSIVEHDPNFAQVYLREKILLLDVLQEGDARLHEAAVRFTAEGLATLGGAAASASAFVGQQISR